MRADTAPLAFTGIALGVALGLDLATQNGLWFWYSFTGLALFVLFLGIARTHRWQIPRGAAWGIGVTASLHYIGGSLSGLHQIGGPNGLYYAFPWWDNVVHFLGSAAVAIAALAWLDGRRPHERALNTFLAVALANLAGVLVELFEFSQFVFLGTIDQGFYSNNLLDLYYNLLGAVAAAVLYGRWTGTAEPNPEAVPT